MLAALHPAGVTRNPQSQLLHNLMLAADKLQLSQVSYRCCSQRQQQRNPEQTLHTAVLNHRKHNIKHQSYAVYASCSLACATRRLAVPSCSVLCCAVLQPDQHV
jgi:hypothetical protein